MRRRLTLTLISVGLLATAIAMWGLVQVIGFPRPPLRDAIPLESGALSMLTPQLVAGGVITQYAWHPEGRYLLCASLNLKQFDAQSRRAVIESALWLWDQKELRSTRLWNQTWQAQGDHIDFAALRTIAWSATTPEALILAQFRENGTFVSRLYSLNAATRSWREIAQGDFQEVDAHPKLPYWLVSGGMQTPPLVVTRNAQVAPLVVPEPQAAFWLTGWDPEQPIAYGTYTFRALHRTNETEEISRHFAVDLRQKTITEIPTIPQPRISQFEARRQRDSLPTEVGTLAIMQETLPARPPETLRAPHLTWLVSKVGKRNYRYLLGANLRHTSFTPKRDALFYIGREGAFVVPLVQILTSLPAEQLREQLTSQAKQIGLALLMYVQDYDEIFPPADQDLAFLLTPYTRDSSVFQNSETGVGFVYLLDAIPIAQIQSPAETMAGYFEASGGRVVVYADGHVEWVPDKNFLTKIKKQQEPLLEKGIS